jgi:hypothetical protein
MNSKWEPIEGQSHWCEGHTLFGRKCRNVVLNTSGHCEAGHKNTIRSLLHQEPYDTLISSSAESFTGGKSGLSLETDETFRSATAGAMADVIEDGSNYVLVQKWDESERGWGVRPDGFSLHLDKNDLTAYIKRHWDGMPDLPPPEYSRPSGVPYMTGVSDAVVAQIRATKDGLGMRYWHSVPYPPVRQFHVEEGMYVENTTSHTPSEIRKRNPLSEGPPFDLPPGARWAGEGEDIWKYKHLMTGLWWHYYKQTTIYSGHYHTPVVYCESEAVADEVLAMAKRALKRQSA